MWELFGDYNEADLLFLGDWGLGAVVLLTLLGALVLGISWYDLRDLSARRQWTLILLRMAVYLLAVVMLLEPALELRNVTKIKNHVAILIDTSRSQTLQVDDDTTRLDRVKAAMADASVRANFFLVGRPGDGATGLEEKEQCGRHGNYASCWRGTASSWGVAHTTHSAHAWWNRPGLSFASSREPALPPAAAIRMWALSRLKK